MFSSFGITYEFLSPFLCILNIEIVLPTTIRSNISIGRQGVIGGVEPSDSVSFLPWSSGASFALAIIKFDVVVHFLFVWMFREFFSSLEPSCQIQ